MPVHAGGLVSTQGQGCGVMVLVHTGRPAAYARPATEPRVGLVGDVVDELRWTFTSRKGWMVGIAANLAIATGYIAYTRYDSHLRGDIRIANIGILIVLGVLADVVNTNQLGSDSHRVIASLQRGDRARRILAIKNLALAVFLVPLAIAISVLLRVLVGRWNLLAHTVIFDIAAVFLWLGVGSVASVLLPYRPISLRARWKARSTWPRWAICLALPYALVFVLVPLLHLPYGAVYNFKLLGPYLPNYLGYSSVYLAQGVAYWIVGLWLASLYAERHPKRLGRDLSRSD